MIDRRDTWITVSTHIDTETGELISKDIAKKEYIKIKTIKKIDHERKYVQLINEYKRTDQLKLF